MSAALAYADAGLAVARRDLVIFRSYRYRFVGQVLRSLFSVALFYYISRLVSVGRFRSPDAYFAYVVVGLVIMEVVLSGFNSVVTRVRQELVAGTFEKLVVSPLGPVVAVMALGLFPVLMAFATGLMTILLSIAVFGLHLRWSTAAAAIPLAVLAWLAFTPFGFFACGSVILFKQAQTTVGFVATGISFVGGFMFPPALLPVWIRWTSEIQPFTPAVELLRLVLVGTPLTEPIWVELAKVAGFAIVLLPLSALFLSRCIRMSQRRGTITEY